MPNICKFSRKSAAENIVSGRYSKLNPVVLDILCLVLIICLVRNILYFNKKNILGLIGFRFEFRVGELYRQTKKLKLIKTDDIMRHSCLM